MPKPKPKKISYKPGPLVKKLTKSLTQRQAMVPEIIKTADLKQRAMKMHIRGRDMDYIARRLDLTTQEVHSFLKEEIKRWMTDQSFDPAEMREVVAKRYDAPLALAFQQAFPHPRTDEFGRPVMGNICNCELEDGQLCSEEGHTAQKISRPDVSWLKVYLEVLAEQKKMFGLDAADKIEQAKVDILERTYRGVDAKVIDNL